MSRDVLPTETVSEEELSTEHLRHLLDRNPLAIAFVDPEDRVRHCNEAFERLFGYSAAESRGRDIKELVAQDVGDGAEACSRKVHGGQVVDTRATRRHKDGSPIEVAIRGIPVRVGGRAAGAFAVYEDLGPLRALEQEVGRVRRLEALGRLAGGVAHDFNNLLTGITGYASFLRDDLASHPDALEDVDQILDAARRAEHLVQQLLSFSRRKVADTAVYDANSAVRELREVLDRLLPNEIRLETDVPSEPAWVQGDRPQLESAVINLVLNARDALPEGGTVQIRSLAPSDDGLTIEVEDDGVGMDDEVLRQACEPFFSTKERSEDGGRGLGLASVYGFVSASGGRFELRSSPGAGTTARMTLPVANVTDAEPAADQEDAGSGDSTPTILVVDDEAMVRRLIIRSLADEGYEVLEARGPAEALELCAEQEAAIDLLVTDVIMPGMSGVELAEKIADSQPDLRALYVSGYAEDVAPSRSGKLGATEFLPKPFSAEEIREQVARQLGKQTPGS